MSSHISGQSKEAEEQLWKGAAERIAEMLKKSTVFAYNIPEGCKEKEAFKVHLNG